MEVAGHTHLLWRIDAHPSFFYEEDMRVSPISNTTNGDPFGGAGRRTSIGRASCQHIVPSLSPS
jgi:hypothetical protein